MTPTSRTAADGYLTDEALSAAVHEGLNALPVDGRRVLVIIPDGTRTMPMPRMHRLIQSALGPRTAALDYLVALGTHSPMSDAQLGALLGDRVVDGRVGRSQVFNHRWDDPATFVQLGVIPSHEVEVLSEGRLHDPVPVALNRLVVDYDHVIVCGPVFPHEVAGFSGGTKYLFPGIAAPDIIHFTHWLGALITNFAIIGTADTPVRRAIDRAASLLPTPLSLLALVVNYEGVAGVFCGEPHQTWKMAAALSSRRHIIWVDKPFDRILSVMPPMYEDLWTAGKGAYKAEPAIAEGGEIVILAPHVREVSHVHGALIEEIGYHCRDYFLGNWERFKHYPGGILAHSTHVKGVGTYDRATGVETPRATVTLATGIPESTCHKINLGYRLADSIDPATFAAESDGRTLVIPRAGEMLYRVGTPPMA